MSTFPLRVGTPDGLLYEGDVARVVCRTISGDLAILPGHCNYCTALGMGEAHIVLEDVSWQRPGSGKRILMQSAPRLPNTGPSRRWQTAV